jgi:hypothetical protein
LFTGPRRRAAVALAARPRCPAASVLRDRGEAGLVEIAKGPAAFAEALARVLSRPREDWLRAVDRRLSEISWGRS